MGERKIKDLISGGLESVDKTLTVFEVTKLMADKNVGAVVVTDKNDVPCGIFTERDLLKRVVSNGVDTKIPVCEVMTPKFICGYAEDTVDEVIDVMLNGNFRHLPIVEGEGMKGFKAFTHQETSKDKLMGMISLRDLLKH